MTRIRHAPLLLPVLMLAGCGAAPQPQPQATAATTPIPTPAPTPAPASTPAGMASSAPGPVPSNVPSAVPDLTPPVLTPTAERGVKGARNLLLSFARAIELRAYDQAWAMLSPADRRKWDRAGFAALFADLDRADVAIPQGTIEGAAGSSYYTAPITISGRDRDGRPVRMAGEAVLRRANDVDGASAAQLRWHFERLTLDWTH